LIVRVAEDRLPPPLPPGPLAWLQQNLFNGWFNSLLTLVALVLTVFILNALLRWLFLSADWTPVVTRPLLYAVGQYPRDQIWRVAAVLLLVSSLFGLSWGVWGGLMRSFGLLLGAVLGITALIPLQDPNVTLQLRALLLANPALIYLGYLLASRISLRGRYVLLGWIAVFLATPILLRGFDGSQLLPRVVTERWGGLLVNILLAVAGIGFSFPIGVLLALGRRSSLPMVKFFSTLFIEVVRGVPLVSILFMSSIILALFLPSNLRIDRLLRAMAGMTLFSAAYVAENVRGGLQAIPRGQIEAAKALGFNNFYTTFIIVLPQALRLVIPALVGQFISLFKDTTLAIVVAINELLNIGKSVLNSNPQFIPLQAEVYLFVGAVFWILSYLMSFASRRLEATMGVGQRN
jgi:general L-amino acid transport system permease protein